LNYIIALKTSFKAQINNIIAFKELVFLNTLGVIMSVP